VRADTGTYRIVDYSVRLAPQNDGRVRISIDQQWEVTGGNIPWVTVGLPGPIFTIEGFGGAAKKVSNGSGNGFFGVRCDLDKDYTAGQTFRVQFTVLQSNLLERLPKESQWRIVYTIPRAGMTAP
jgi:hypothetical protein